MLGDIKHGLHFYEQLWRPGELAVSNMERRGIRLNRDVCSDEVKETGRRVSRIRDRLTELTNQDINWASPKQVSLYLYDQRGLPIPPVSGTSKAVQMTQRDKRPTSEAALEWLRDHCQQDWIGTLLDLKSTTKLCSFWETLPSHVGKDGRIHPQLAPSTETGRLSCKNPNLQQQPPETRRAFVAAPGKVLVALDYSGLEWRVLAHVLAHRYKDMSLVGEIVDGVDPHSATAVKMGLCPGPVEDVKGLYPKQRADAKILNYSINYGKTAAGLGVQIRDSSGNGIGAKAGQGLLDAFYEARPGIARFHRDIVKYAQGKGGVRSLLGRFRPITQPYEIRTKWGVREGPGARQAKNVIQNCATDVVWMAMVRVDQDPGLAGLGFQMILQNHDELVLEGPAENAAEAEARARLLMVTCLDGVREFLCPLGVDGGAGPDWGSCK